MIKSTAVRAPLRVANTIFAGSLGFVLVSFKSFLACSHWGAGAALEQRLRMHISKTTVFVIATRPRLTFFARHLDVLSSCFDTYLPSTSCRARLRPVLEVLQEIEERQGYFYD